jgi:hypothetical protein
VGVVSTTLATSADAASLERTLQVRHPHLHAAMQRVGEVCLPGYLPRASCLVPRRRYGCGGR